MSRLDAWAGHLQMAFIRFVCRLHGHRWRTLPLGANFRFCARCGTTGYDVGRKR